MYREAFHALSLLFLHSRLKHIVTIFNRLEKRCDCQLLTVNYPINNNNSLIIYIPYALEIVSISTENGEKMKVYEFPRNASFHHSFTPLFTPLSPNLSPNLFSAFMINFPPQDAYFFAFIRLFSPHSSPTVFSEPFSEPSQLRRFVNILIR